MTKYYYSLILLLFTFSLFSQTKNDETFKVLFSDANKMLLSSNYDSAKVLFFEALNIKESAAVNFALAKIYYSQEDYYLSLKFAEKAYNIYPDQKWYQLLLFDVYVHLNDFNNAIIILEKIISSSDVTQDEYLLGLNFYSELGDYNKVLNILSNFIQNFGYNTDIVEIYYNTLYNLSDSLHFLDVSKQFLDLYSNDEYVLNLTFRYYILFGLYSDASSLLSNFNINDNYYSFIISAEQNDVNNSYNSLISFLNSQSTINSDLDNIFDDYTTFIIDNFSNDQLNSLIKYFAKFDQLDYQTSFFIATAYKKLHFYYDAINFFESAIDFNPSDFNTFTTLMNLYSKLQLWQKLDSISSLAMDYYPARPYFYLFKGISLLYQNNYDEALIYFNTAKTYSFGDSTLLSYTSFYLSEYYRLSNDKTNQITYYNNALSYANSNCDLLLHFAFVFLRNDIFPNNVEQLLSSCSYKSSLYYTYLLAFYYYRIKDFDNSLSTMNRLLTSFNSDDFIYYELLGSIYNKLGNSDKAEFYWQLSIEFGNYFINKNI